ncbi:hypothetical protein cypCar_00037081 [Cyprinus carpio]|nr:hypothetical protein cypCar_00037081 [Cyprinus carpio]
MVGPRRSRETPSGLLPLRREGLAVAAASSSARVQASGLQDAGLREQWVTVMTALRRWRRRPGCQTCVSHRLLLSVLPVLSDLSRNRLTELPVDVCMFVSLESLNLYQNCLRSLPESLINLQSLTYLNISRVGRAAVVRLDFPVTRANDSISACMLPRQSRGHLQSIIIDNNPLQADLHSLYSNCLKLLKPWFNICIKGKIHIFKYLNMESCKAASELPDYDRRPLPFGSW